MKVERMDKATGEVDYTTLKDCIEHTEGRGYWKPGTIEKMLEEGNGVFTPFYIYNKAEAQACDCTTPLIYSALTTECLRCGGVV